MSAGGGPLTAADVVELMRRLGEATAPDPALAPEQQVRAAVSSYLAFAEANHHEYRAVYKDGQSSDPEVRAVAEASLDRSAERMFALLAPDVRSRELVRVVVHGWFRFLVEACLRWLDERRVQRDQLLEVCLDALFSGVASATRQTVDEADW